MLLLTNSFGRVFFVGVKRFTNLKLLISIEEMPDVKSQFSAAVCWPPRLLDQNVYVTANMDISIIDNQLV